VATLYYVEREFRFLKSKSSFPLTLTQTLNLAVFWTFRHKTGVVNQFDRRNMTLNAQIRLNPFTVMHCNRRG